MTNGQTTSAKVGTDRKRLAISDTGEQASKKKTKNVDLKHYASD